VWRCVAVCGGVWLCAYVPARVGTVRRCSPVCGGVAVCGGVWWCMVRCVCLSACVCSVWRGGCVCAPARVGGWRRGANGFDCAWLVATAHPMAGLAGASALAYIRGGSTADVMLLDVVMPNLSGVQVMQEAASDMDVLPYPVVRPPPPPPPPPRPLHIPCACRPVCLPFVCLCAILRGGARSQLP
jgi:hypothetical protein